MGRKKRINIFQKNDYSQIVQRINDLEKRICNKKS